MTEQQFKRWWPGFLNEYWAALTASYEDPARYNAVRDAYMLRGLKKIAGTDG